MLNQRFILIIGGGHLGYYLSKALIDSGNEVVLIERDKNVVSELRHVLGDVVIQGDGTDLGVLVMAGIERADIIVATTGYDEDNFTIALMAKEHFGVPKAVTRLRDPNNETLFKNCGIDETVCSTSVILSLLEQQIDSSSVIPIAALDKGNIEVVELKLDEFSPAIGLKISDLGLKKGCLIISIIRGEKSYIPVADSILSVDDEIILLIPKGTLNEIKGVFINLD